jgi:phage gp46-like protein
MSDQMATYTGDLLLVLNQNGDWDLEYINGQPRMTDGFETAVMLSVFVEPDFWQNDLTNIVAEKYISEFPEVIKNGRVDNDTLNDGISALKKALKWMIDTEAASKIEVTGGFINVYALYWEISIFRTTGETRYQINWDKQEVTVLRAA